MKTLKKVLAAVAACVLMSSTVAMSVTAVDDWRDISSLCPPHDTTYIYMYTISDGTLTHQITDQEHIGDTCTVTYYREVFLEKCPNCELVFGMAQFPREFHSIPHTLDAKTIAANGI